MLILVAVATPKTGVTKVGEPSKTNLPVPVAPVEVTPSIVWWPVKVLAASVRAIVADVEGNVMVVPSDPEKVREFVTATVLALVIVNVPVEEVIVSPLTLVGVIAPRVSVIAGVVVAVATEPETPLAVVTDTDVTVPPPEALVRSLCVVGSA